MARFTLILFAACAIGTGVASAFDDAAAEKKSLKHATREELLAKIANLEQQLTDLKSQQKQRKSQHESLAKWLTYTAPLTGQALPVPTPPLPPGIFALPEYQEPGTNGLHSPAMPNVLRDPLSDMPKGTSARPFNGMIVYDVPCILRSKSEIQTSPANSAYTNSAASHFSHHRYGKKPYHWPRWSEIQWNLTEKPLPMKTSSAASLRP